MLRINEYRNKYVNFDPQRIDVCFRDAEGNIS